MQASQGRALDTSVLIFGIIVLAAVLTWIVPAGEFQKETINVTGVGERQVVIPGSFQTLEENNPQGLGAVLAAPIRGLIAAADVVGFVLIVGGAFSVLTATGAVDAGLRRLVAAAERSPLIERLIVPIFMVLFSLGGAIFGMAEETIPFVLMFVPMARSLGYDAVVGTAIPMVGAGSGFAAAFLNPFTVGVAQGIAEVPLFSGIGLRIGLWFFSTGIAIAFVTGYAHRIKQDPSMSVMVGMENTVPEHLADSVESLPSLDRRFQLVLLTFAASLVLLVVGVIRFGWYIEELAALFVGVAIALGFAARIRPTALASAFMDGTRALVGTAMIIGMARGILVVLESGQVIDTLLNAMASTVGGLGATGSAAVMFAVQTALNFFVPSGSGQAALTMPIMAPLADLVGVTRQTAVLAFQLGDGYTNMIVPTNAVLIGSITLGGVPWARWARWILPLQLTLFALGMIVLAVAVSVGYA